MTDHAAARRRMVEHDLAGRGITDANVLQAMGRVRREAFVPRHLQEFAYDDAPLPIGKGQTISQPLIVALMSQALQLRGLATERVLEIGTGSGYAAAVLAEMQVEVYSVERIAVLADRARRLLAQLGYAKVGILEGDGTLGWPEHAPYDAIIVAAGGPEPPQPLLAQLKIGGRLVIPIGTMRREQVLVRITRMSEQTYKTEELMDVRFVPLVGAEGW